jgi:hypothetical protein
VRREGGKAMRVFLLFLVPVRMYGPGGHGGVMRAWLRLVGWPMGGFGLRAFFPGSVAHLAYERLAS